MAEKMEDTNSWNEMIFQQIRARREWILALIWKKRLELENDTAHGETNEVEEKKNMDLDHEDPLFTKWCDERREEFEDLLKKPTGDDTVKDKETNFSSISEEPLKVETNFSKTEEPLRRHPNDVKVEAKKTKSSSNSKEPLKVESNFSYKFEGPLR